MAETTLKLHYESPEARESQLINLAEALAEKQLREGTASAQVICHYLKLATTRDRIEREILEKQKDLVVAKTESLQASKANAQMFEEAIKSMRSYTGEEDISQDENIC